VRRSFCPAKTVDPQSIEHEDQWITFRKICDDAANVAEELLGRLDRLKVKGGKHRLFRNLKQAIETLWSEKEVAGLLK
jgi:hypothetical protein